VCSTQSILDKGKNIMATNSEPSSGVHNLFFITLYGTKAPPAPAVTLGLKDYKFTPVVYVTNAIGEPEEGVAVEFDCPGIPNGTGISDAKGFARSSEEAVFTEELFYLLNARVKNAPETIKQMLVQVFTIV
jgi:hypothetical protein